ncbi:hypothetical protein WJ47_14370 [Burkholderia ubonensis]|uniref:Uncharacterized protein n=1 Tax=Burkholderia ubonensis TaxID=101571 RepID=A0AB73G8L1_9BURK|nr:hypothetical protein [Burkholderia ubonensis]KVC69629.1 hypothetical protein WI74_23810 [Burkholderia ubonensis]KVC77523.1 hypothetical protein WI75_16640 [Burkholderia ubonensis]KVK84065.1 hypothetical protein WJ44_05080 [Burkholderia ubonensis]KVL65649.1 hypothetical protein WJ47_14370 [Burkholderia ubonensis]KVM30786.1 hypothetical protein WJ54_01690 [Burkholderia ubonensis]
MGVLVINDLPESVDLDRQAMAAITGGAMVRAHQTMLAPRTFPFLHTDAQDAASTRAPAADAAPSRARPTLLR